MLQLPSVPETSSKDDPPARGRFSYFLWVITFAAAVAVEQLTDSVTLAAIMPCAHAGWKTLRCAFWLKRSDPVSPRARACFLFYVATACWKAAAAAVLTAFLCAEAAELNGQKPPKVFLNVLLVILAGGGCLTALVGIFAVVSAFRGKVRVWINTSVREICRGDFNRIVCLPLYYRQGINQALFTLAISVFLSVIGSGTGLVIWGSAISVNTNEVPLVLVLTIAGLVLMTAGPLVMIPVFGYLSSRIIAKTPADCWSQPFFYDPHT